MVLGDLTLVRPLGMAGVPSVVVTEDPADATLRSRHVVGRLLVPGWEPPFQDETAAALVTLGARLREASGRRALLVPGSDLQMEVLLDHAAALREHYVLALNAPELAAALHDKRAFAELARAAGLHVPPTRAATEDLAGLRPPLLVKPRRKTRWKEIQRELLGGAGKARLFATAGDLARHPAFERHRDELIVQERIREARGGLVSFHGFAGRPGEILASFCGRKVRTWPDFAGESAFIELSVDPQVEATGRHIAARLGLVGPFKIDLVREAGTGALYVLEINDRFNLWHYLGAVHGVNLLAVAHEHLVGGEGGEGGAGGREPTGDGEPGCEPRYRYLDLYRDYHAFRELHREGRLGAAPWLASLLSPRNVHATFAWDDPVPALQSAWTFLRRRIRSWRATESSRTFTATSKPCAPR